MFSSDHSPLWIRAGETHAQRNPKPFKFIAAWLTHDGFEELVQSHWNHGLAWEDNVKKFSIAATAWNKNTFGHIQKKKKQRILNRLSSIHISLTEGPNLFLEDFQQFLW